MGTVALIVLLSATLGGQLCAGLLVADGCPLHPGLPAGHDAAFEAVTQAAP